MPEFADLTIGNKQIQLPLIIGSENEPAIDIAKLRDLTGHVTLDPGFKNTGATKSAITFLDGEEGILRYRGFSIEELAEKASFTEVAFLLIYGELPNTSQLADFEKTLQKKAGHNQALYNIFDAFPSNTHPMVILSALLGAMNAFNEDNGIANDDNMMNLMANITSFATWTYRKNDIKKEAVAPDSSLDYCSNFLNMMFSKKTGGYIKNPVVVSAINKLLILHADHEQNCSTSTVRLVGSSHATLYSSIAAGVNALSGPLHGGANQEVIEMLEAIKADGGDTDKYLAMAKDKTSGFRLMGFGHRVYKNFDPRARIIKKAADEVLEALGVNDPILEIAKKLEAAALSDEYFVARKLYPNVDFYSGIIYRALGIPTDMFTVMFAIGRLPGWMAQWKEMRVNKEPIGRPRQIYTGSQVRGFISIDQR